MSARLLPGLVLGIFGCGATLGASIPDSAMLRARAEADLECPDEVFAVTPQDERTVAVRGCGRRATYLSTCETCAAGRATYRCRCTWSLAGTVAKVTTAREP